jgi:insulysin
MLIFLKLLILIKFLFKRVLDILFNMTKIKKSSIDKREYKYLKLDNKIKVLLVSDPDTEKSATAVNVNVGCFSDPDNFPGLAHFLEHMLFMGSDKYPDENLFEEKLTEFGGSYNAYTDSERTVYHLELFNQHFEEILKIFSRFFIDPLMKKEGVDREINAVDSENNKNLTSDYWRLNQLVKSFSNPKSPFHKFGTGNLSTLSDSKIRDVLLNFHEKYYSANIMCLVLLSNKKISDLEKLAKKYFSEIVNKDVKIDYQYDKLPFDTEYPINRTFFVKLINDINELSLIWQLPNQTKNYKKKSISLLSSLLGDENNGSIAIKLKDEGLINSLMSGTADEEDNYNLFNITIELTNDGIKKIDYIIETIYDYISLLKSTTSDDFKRLAEEYQQIANIHFEYQEKFDPMNFCTMLAVNLEKYKHENVISGSYLMEDYDEDNLKSLLGYFRLDNMMTLVGNNKLNDKRKPMKEKYYSTEYLTRTNYLNSLENSKNNDLNLPPKNKFIPNNFDLGIEKSKNKPNNIIKNNREEVWHCFNNQFNLPLDIYWLQIVSLELNKTTETFIMTSIIIEMINEYLNPELYNAIEAGYGYKLNFNPYHNSIVIKVKGYSQKINLILKEILNVLFNFSNNFEELKFNMIKNKFKRDTSNIPLLAPYQLLNYNLEKEWIINFRGYQNLIETVDSITFDDTLKFCKNIMLKNMFLKCVNCGNLSKNDLVSFDSYKFSNIEKPFKSIASINPKYGVHSFKNKNEEDTNDAIGIFYYIGEYSFRKISKMLLYSLIAGEPFFDTLRTKEQLGYIVRSSKHSFLNNYGILQLIQSSNKDCDYLEKRIKDFNFNYTEKLKSLEQGKFNLNKQTLISKLEEKDDNISELTFRQINEVLTERYIFDRRKKLVNEVKKLEIKDILNFHLKYIIENKKVTIIKNTKN